jgi:intracellular multiplication protein IcmW
MVCLNAIKFERRILIMPKLDLLSAHEFWRNYDDPIIYRVVAFMESVEHWTVDGHPDIERELDALGEALEGLTKFELTQEDYYVNILCHLKMARVLRIMQAIDTTYPGSASKLLMYAEGNTKNIEDACGLFLRRNIVFERLRLLSRVFSVERFNIISKALEGEV